jgi:hypothetical protein
VRADRQPLALRHLNGITPLSRNSRACGIAEAGRKPVADRLPWISPWLSGKGVSSGGFKTIQ